MSKTVNVVVASLAAVVAAASNAAGSAAELTRAACVALLAGAHEADVIEAVKGGYQERGQDMPAGMSSNLKRLAAADPELIALVRDGGYALNNKTLEFFGVPKVSKAGRPAGQGAGKATATAANSGAAVDPITAGGAGDAPSPMHRWMRTLNDFRQNVFILRDAKNEVMTAEDATRAQNLAAEMVALLGKYTA